MELLSIYNYTITHVVDNIVWKNKDLNSPETYNTNWILIQNCSDDQQFSQSVHVKPNYDFSRKDHKSFKAVKTTLPDINFKIGIPKLVPSIIEDDQNKEFQKSSNKTLGWILLRDHTAHHYFWRLTEQFMQKYWMSCLSWKMKTIKYSTN